MAFSLFNKLNEQKWGLVAVYTGAVALLAFFLQDTYRYVLSSKPYDYMPNFYNMGPYYWLFVLYFFVVSGYFFTVVAHQYATGNEITKKRAGYFMLAFGWAYIFGSIGFLPIFHFNIDLMPSVLLGLYTIPLAYGVLKYDLMDMHIFAKRAFLYGIGTALLGFIIVGINILNNILVKSIVGFPHWLIPFISALVTTAIAHYVWMQLKSADAVKYEFINTISHKFRTPLTHIRWIAEELRTETASEKRNQYVDQIQYSSMRLFELTNIVMDVAQNEVDDNFYRITPVQVEELLQFIKDNHQDQIKRKDILVEMIVGENVPVIEADKTRLQFALQILFENALGYTPEHGKVIISVQHNDHKLYIIFKDSGIGIEQKEIPFMFSKFYRTSNARRADTEGMGLGLYIAKNIITKHHGDIWVESDGINKGASFNISLPLKG
jgi:signal transduction histidine kinase